MLAVFNVLHISHRITLLEISCVFPCNEQMVERGYEVKGEILSIILLVILYT